MKKSDGIILIIPHLSNAARLWHTHTNIHTHIHTQYFILILCMAQISDISPSPVNKTFWVTDTTISTILTVCVRSDTSLSGSSHTQDALQLLLDDYNQLCL